MKYLFFMCTLCQKEKHLFKITGNKQQDMIKINNILKQLAPE